MAPLTLVKMLSCGQGMMTLVEVYNCGTEKNAADYLALIDCGGREPEGAGALAYVKSKVAFRGHLDNVVISHQDEDHVALLEELAAMIPGSMTPNPGLPRDGVIFYGGENWSNTNFMKLTKFATAVNCREYREIGNVSDYRDAADHNNLGALCGHGDVRLRTLISNVRLTTGDAGMQRNASSAVVAVDTGSHTVILAGDATSETMDEINGFLPAKRSLLGTVVGLGLPHHGSLRTSVENHVSSDLTDANFRSVRLFAEQVSAKHVGASAGPGNGYGHPAEEVIDVAFSPFVVPRVEKHSYMEFQYEKSTWATQETTYGIWCTVVSIGGPFRVADRRYPSLHMQPGSMATGDIVLTLNPGLAVERMVKINPRTQMKPSGPTPVTALLAPAP